MSGSGLVALPNVREWSGGPPNVQEGLEVLLECPGVVERPTKCPGMVKRQSRESGKGWETLLEVCEGSGGLTKTWKG